MPEVTQLKLPPAFAAQGRRATHEDYTIKAIVDSSFTETFKSVHKRWGVEFQTVAALITGETQDLNYFTVEGINFFPLLHQLISSEMDCDRMDYLLRDSYFSGVSYGQYDLDWILDNLKICKMDNVALLTYP